MREEVGAILADAEPGFYLNLFGLKIERKEGFRALGAQLGNIAQDILVTALEMMGHDVRTHGGLACGRQADFHCGIVVDEGDGLR